MILQKAATKDIEEIMHIEQNAFSAEIQESRQTFLERISVFPAGFILLKIDGEVQGYLSSELWKELPDFEKNFDVLNLGHSALLSHKIGGTILYISSFAILPNIQKKGIGKDFFSAAISQIAAEVPFSMQALLVNEKWHSALSIYKKAGFRKLRLLKNFFVDGKSFSDGIFMIKNNCPKKPNLE